MPFQQCFGAKTRSTVSFEIFKIPDKRHKPEGQVTHDHDAGLQEQNGSQANTFLEAECRNPLQRNSWFGQELGAQLPLTTRTTARHQFRDINPK